MDVRVTRRDVGPRTVISVEGEIDVSTADVMRDRIAEPLAEQRSDLVVDLLGVQFMDSTGLGVLVGAHKKVRAHGGRLVLVVDSERLLTVLRITALLPLFRVFSTVDDALAD